MWLVKTEPGTYSYEDLEREGRAAWDGIGGGRIVRRRGDPVAG